MAKKAFVVAVTGISGAGKTSVVERTVELLGNAAKLHFDDYRSVSTYPTDLKQWLEAGADVEVWKTPRLASDLRTLLSGRPIHLPEDRGVVEPAEVIVMEEPFGKSRREMATLIDLAVHIDVPADILLARRLLRRLKVERDLFDDRLLDQLRRDLDQHLHVGRDLDARGNRVAGAAADLVFDGTRTVDELADELVGEIHRRQQLELS